MKELDYYFKNIENFTEKEIFENTKFVWEPLSKIDNYLKEKIVDKDIKINKAKTEEFCSIQGNYFIDENTKIGANTTIIGPVIIGKNVTIMPGVLIRPGTIIGDNVVMGANSIVLGGVKIGNDVFSSRCIC